MTAYLCYLCKALDDDNEAHTVPVGGEDALVCQACVDKAEDVRSCAECCDVRHLDDLEHMDCCDRWLCEECREDHADVHMDDYTYNGVSRRDFA